MMGTMNLSALLKEVEDKVGKEFRSHIFEDSNEGTKCHELYGIDVAINEYEDHLGLVFVNNKECTTAILIDVNVR